VRRECKGDDAKRARKWERTWMGTQRWTERMQIDFCPSKEVHFIVLRLIKASWSTIK